MAHGPLTGGFFGFWVKNRKMTLLIIFIIILRGSAALFTLPKVLFPDINVGIISIGTAYPGVAPQDIDALITSEIEKEIKDVEGIDSINSSSSLGFSSIVLSLTSDADSTDVLNKVKSLVDTVTLPEDATTPVVVEQSFPDILFNVMLTAPTNAMTYQELLDHAASIQKKREQSPYIKKVSVAGSAYYDIEVQVDQNKAERLGLSLDIIAGTIGSYYTSQPLGNHKVGTNFYDYSLAKVFTQESQLGYTPLVTPSGSLNLQDIADIQRSYTNESISRNGSFEQQGNMYVLLNVEKSTSFDLFGAGPQAIEHIESVMGESQFAPLNHIFVENVYESVTKEFLEVFWNGLTTIGLVFLIVWFFVGIKESIIAALAIPLAFFITFGVLKYLDLSLNVLTNISLIVSFGIAVDAIIVILEGAAEKHKLGYGPMHSALLAVREYKWPLIAGTATTLVVFIPLFTLPGILGKFVSYIPITIFFSLLAALVISLTINPVFYYLFTKKSKTFIQEEETEVYLSPEEKELLAQDRKGKTQKKGDHSWREKFFAKIDHGYEKFVAILLKNRLSRFAAIVLPFVLLVLSFFLPISFSLTPASDEGALKLTIQAPNGKDIEVFAPYLDRIDTIASSFPEVETWYYSINRNVLQMDMQLFDEKDRIAQGMRSVFQVEEDLIQELKFLQSFDFQTNAENVQGGPPTGAPVGIKLLARNTDFFDELTKTSKVFEEYLKTLEGTKNVKTTVKDTPGKFQFVFDYNVLQVLGLTPRDISFPLFRAMFGVKATTIASDTQDHDVRVVYEQFADQLQPNDVENIVVPTSRGQVRAGDVLDYAISNSVESILREDTELLISVSSQVKDSSLTPTIQQSLIDFADQYDFPDGISYKSASETDNNSELLTSVATSALIAIVLIFAILVLQFGSYRQPLFILYSIFISILGVNVGLWLTGNEYSLFMFIGFIALMGIVVNDAIVLVDKINSNMDKGMAKYDAIVQAAGSRVQPIVLTTVTTILGLISVADINAFFAGLAVTIMFGLFVGSSLTLLVIPVLFFSFVKEKKNTSEA